MGNNSEEIKDVGLKRIADRNKYKSKPSVSREKNTGMAKIPKSGTAENVTLETGPDFRNMSRMHNDISTSHIRDYRWLAIASIICGISCIGISALINSVKVQERRESDPEKAQVYSGNARKLSFIAIAVWVGLLILIPMLMALLSYLFTLQD
ncbi:hypothetical protein COCON_G00031600 [Conger conger]|uniref:Transmembrane protein 265 n=1 Tax=Conger conger TaxID=82655 RepID=A0A9Q1I771_CONCO|nr:hypothetical protein COCON_G00031600 [Conger conger]